jgi:hypothetical protein
MKKIILLLIILFSFNFFNCDDVFVKKNFKTRIIYNDGTSEVFETYCKIPNTYSFEKDYFVITEFSDKNKLPVFINRNNIKRLERISITND